MQELPMPRPSNDPIHKLLAFDPGTKLGWALHYNGDVRSCDVVKLPTDRGQFFNELNSELIRLISFHWPIHAIAYEKVWRHAATGAAHLYGGIEAFILWRAHLVGCRVLQVGVQRAKKLATGRSDARKEEMLEAAAKRWPHFPFVETIKPKGKKGRQRTVTHPDLADACWLAVAAADELGW